MARSHKCARAAPVNEQQNRAARAVRDGLHFRASRT